MSFGPRSVAELQLARIVAQERYATIAARNTPIDIKIRYDRKNLSGRAYVISRIISVPRPTTRRRLHVYLHEVAHVVLDHQNQNPRYVEEFQAEQWAFDIMRKEGVRIPRKALHEAQRYVKLKIKQALARKAKSIDPAAAKFAKVVVRKPR